MIFVFLTVFGKIKSSLEWYLRRRAPCRKIVRMCVDEDKIECLGGIFCMFCD